jgi:hypothetical protein
LELSQVLLSLVSEQWGVGHDERDDGEVGHDERDDGEVNEGQDL